MGWAGTGRRCSGPTSGIPAALTQATIKSQRAPPPPTTSAEVPAQTEPVQQEEEEEEEDTVMTPLGDTEGRMSVSVYNEWV